MHIDISGDDKKRRYRITDITQAQHNMLIKDLSPTTARCVASRRGEWKGNVSTITVDVAPTATGANVDRLIRTAVGGAV